MIKRVELPLEGPDLSDFPLFSEDYQVWVNDEPCQVRACRVSAMPFNRTWPGRQRPLEQTEIASFVSFSADEEVVLRVKCRRAFRQALVRPLSRGIEAVRKDDSVEFILKDYGR